MRHDDDRRPATASVRPPWTTVAPLIFGVALLIFLYAIDRAPWFHIRPASGTAAAMGHAAEQPRTNAPAP